MSNRRTCLGCSRGKLVSLKVQVIIESECMLNVMKNL